MEAFEKYWDDYCRSHHYRTERDRAVARITFKAALLHAAEIAVKSCSDLMPNSSCINPQISCNDCVAAAIRKEAGE